MKLRSPIRTLRGRKHRAFAVAGIAEDVWVLRDDYSSSQPDRESGRDHRCQIRMYAAISSAIGGFEASALAISDRSVATSASSFSSGLYQLIV